MSGHIGVADSMHGYAHIFHIAVHGCVRLCMGAHWRARVCAVAQAGVHGRAQVHALVCGGGHGPWPLGCMCVAQA